MALPSAGPRRGRHVDYPQLRRRLAEGRGIPEWFTFPEVARELQKSHPARRHQGFTVFMTGLSGAGKSTVANVLLVKLLEMGGRPVTMLDGDIVRKHLSSELGFSREHRDKARAGLLEEFTGVSDPYEPPGDADVVLDTTDTSPDEAAHEILRHLERLGYIGSELDRT